MSEAAKKRLMDQAPSKLAIANGCSLLMASATWGFLNFLNRPQEPDYQFLMMGKIFGSAALTGGVQSCHIDAKTVLKTSLSVMKHPLDYEGDWLKSLPRQIVAWIFRECPEIEKNPQGNNRAYEWSNEARDLITRHGCAELGLLIQTQDGRFQTMSLSLPQSQLSMHWSSHLTPKMIFVGREEALAIFKSMLPESPKAIQQINDDQFAEERWWRKVEAWHKKNKILKFNGLHLEKPTFSEKILALWQGKDTSIQPSFVTATHIYGYCVKVTRLNAFGPRVFEPQLVVSQDLIGTEQIKPRGKKSVSKEEWENHEWARDHMFGDSFSINGPRDTNILGVPIVILVDEDQTHISSSPVADVVVYIRVRATNFGKYMCFHLNCDQMTLNKKIVGIISPIINKNEALQGQFSDATVEDFEKVLEALKVAAARTGVQLDLVSGIEGLPSKVERILVAIDMVERAKLMQSTNKDSAVAPIK